MEEAEDRDRRAESGFEKLPEPECVEPGHGKL